MKFGEALEYLLAGYKVYRKSWNKNFIEYDREAESILYKKDGQRPAYYVPTQQDILAEDWSLVIVKGFTE